MLCCLLQPLNLKQANSSPYAPFALYQCSLISASFRALDVYEAQCIQWVRIQWVSWAKGLPGHFVFASIFLFHHLVQLLLLPGSDDRGIVIHFEILVRNL